MPSISWNSQTYDSFSRRFTKFPEVLGTIPEKLVYFPNLLVNWWLDVTYLFLTSLLMYNIIVLLIERGDRVVRSFTNTRRSV